MPYKIPMLVEPNKYGIVKGKEILGGYLLNDKEFTSPLIIKNSEWKDQSLIQEKNIIYDTINNISSVGYKINIQVLNFIMENYLNFHLIMDPNEIHPLEKKDKLTILQRKELDSFYSKKRLDQSILGLAHIFKNVPQFFIPVRMDNRGRIYCNSDYLNYQSNELSKALLLFSRPTKISKKDKKSH